MIDYLHAATDEAIWRGPFDPDVRPLDYWSWSDTDRIERVVRVLEQRYGLDRWGTYGSTCPTQRSYLRMEEP